MTDYEERVWARFLDIYNVIPPKVFPPEVDVDATTSKTIFRGKVLATAQVIFAWSRPLCKRLQNLASLEVFRDDWRILRYAIAKSIYLRCPEVASGPRMSDAYTNNTPKHIDIQFIDCYKKAKRFINVSRNKSPNLTNYDLRLIEEA